MARTAKVAYWTTRGGYYFRFKGKPVCLAKGPDDQPSGQTYGAAIRKKLELEQCLTPGPTLGELLQRYDTDTAAAVKPSTRKARAVCINALATAFGSARVWSLCAAEIQGWLDEAGSSGRWGTNTRRNLLLLLKAAMKWALREKIIQDNPVARLKIPKPKFRSARCVLTVDEERAILSACDGPQRDFFATLAATGARPGEIASVEARHFDPRFPAFVLPAVADHGEATHKTARTGRDRVIYLTGDALATALRLVAERPAGPVFRSKSIRGKGRHKGGRGPWTHKAIAEAVKGLRKRTGVSKLIAYSFRHTYASRALTAAEPVPVSALAELMGTSAEMIAKVYGHLADQASYLRKLAQRLNGG